MQDSIAITGANGWLGQNLVQACVRAGIEARAIVRSPEALRVVASLGAAGTVVEELAGGAQVAALAGCRAIVHLAGISAERRGATYESVNVAGMRGVVRAALAAEVPRVVLLSGLGVAHYGMRRRCTNDYFLAKLAAEVELFRSGLEAVVLRPSYIVGAEDELVPALLQEISAGRVEIVGDGSQRLQPLAVQDACEIVLAVSLGAPKTPAVIDLVGPEPLTYRSFVAAVAQAVRAGRSGAFEMVEVPVEEAERQAERGGYRGLLRDELDVLLCDEIADAAPAELWLGRPLLSVAEMLDRAVAGSRPRAGAAFRR